jgi:hypothetical protein
MAARISISSVVPAPFQYAGAGEASEDLKVYLLAIYSYADHLSRQPSLTFQEHLASILKGEVYGPPPHKSKIA